MQNTNILSKSKRYPILFWKVIENIMNPSYIANIFDSNAASTLYYENDYFSKLDDLSIEPIVLQLVNEVNVVFCIRVGMNQMIIDVYQ